MRAALILSSIVAFATAARANGPALGRAGNSVFPLATDAVRLVAEDVVMDLSFRGGDSHVTCTYGLKNLTGEATQIEMGFVAHPLYERDRFLVRCRGDSVFVQFLALDDPRWNEYLGRYADAWPAEESARHASAVRVELVPVWSLSFAPFESLAVTIQYDMAAATGFERGADGEEFQYFARPARLWAGTIERAEFVARFGSEAELVRCVDLRVPPHWKGVISPSGYRWEGNEIHWSFRDWEPDTDFQIGLYQARRLMASEYVWAGDGSDLSPVGAGPAVATLPSYSADHRLSTDSELLEDVRDRYSRCCISPHPGNYTTFAVAYLLARRYEIDARHGSSTIPKPWSHFFRKQTWYAERAANVAADLSPLERENAELFEHLAQRIAGDPSILLPEIPPVHE